MSIPVPVRVIVVKILNDIRKAFEAMNVESEIYIPLVTEEAIAKAAELNSFESLLYNTSWRVIDF